MKTVFVIFGVISRPHALKGAFKVRFYCDDPESFLSLPIKIGHSFAESVDIKPERVFKIEVSTCILECKGVGSYDAANLLRGKKLFVSRHELPKLSDGEYYWQDLVGCEVRDHVGVLCGKLDKVRGQVGSDVGVIKCPDGRTRMFLLSEEWVLNIDLEKLVIIIRKEGLI